VWRYDDGGWSRLVQTWPDAAVPSFICAGDSPCWSRQGSPPAVQRFDPQTGHIGAFTPLGMRDLTALAVDHQGAVWASLLSGAVWRGDATGWRQVHDAERIVRVAPDHAGGAWLWDDEGRLDHLTEGLLDHTQTVERRTSAFATDAAGRPLLGGPNLLRLDKESWTVALDHPVDSITAGSSGWWARRGERIWQETADGPREMPLPFSGPTGVQLGHDGAAWIVQDGHVLRLTEASGPALRERADAWGLSSLGQYGPVHVLDLDGDGRDDLLVGGEQGMQALVQRDGRFEAQDLGVDLPGRPVALESCDLDSNGLEDLLITERMDDPAVHRLRLLRNQGGWLDEVSDTLLPLPPGQERLVGEFTCVDLDGDGDLDVLRAGGKTTHLLPRGVGVLLSDGLGGLSWQTAPARGMGKPGWPQRVVTGDLNGDQRTDLLFDNVWGRGLDLTLSSPDGGWIEATRAAGLGGFYPFDGRSWITDLDRDGVADVLSVAQGIRAWRGDGRGGLVDHTRAWGLGSWAQRFGSPTLVDLAGDGAPDIVAHDAGRVLLLDGRPGGGFVDLSAALPLPITGASAIAALDLGADGDTDLLVIGAGPEHLLENRRELFVALERPPVPTARTAAIARGLRWLEPTELALLLCGLGLLTLAHRRLWRAEARIALGRRSGLGAVALAWVAAWLALLEEPVPTQALALAAPLLLVGFGMPWELRLDLNRRSRRIGGYRLLGLLGRGGMGTVYRALDLSSGEEVALKLVRPELLATESARALYRREARIGASLHDPRLVRLLSWGEWTVVESGERRPTAYLVMELVAGQSLRSVLTERGSLPVGAACAVVREVALGLSAVHAAGVIHRDVKPENVMLSPEGRVRLMEFGASREVDDAGGAQVLGTLHYMPPEQARGRPPEPSADLYACGVMLYELLNGQPPYRARSLAELKAVFAIHERPELRSEFPASLRALVRATLDPDPDGRPDSGELAAALAPLATAPPAVASSAHDTPLERLPAPLGLPALLSRWWRFRSARPEGTAAEFGSWLQGGGAGAAPVAPPRPVGPRSTVGPSSEATWSPDRGDSTFAGASWLSEDAE